MKPSPRLSAILQAVLVTFLWSTSWVLIKLGLRNDLPPVAFAGLRYFLAFLCLAPFVLANPRLRGVLLTLSARDWLRLALMGVITYAFSQSLQYLSLASLPSATLSLVLNLTSVLTAISGIWLLREIPTSLQWIGVAGVAAGVGVYFLPITLEPGQLVGLGFAVACMAGNTASGLFGRQINRRQDIPASIVTFVSMGFGSILMLAFGGLTGGFGRPSGTDWLILAWLALVNTALAFTLWNTTLRTLTAVESSILNNLMMPQIAILALLFLGETLTGKDLAGLALVFAGVLIVQLRGRQKPAAP